MDAKELLNKLTTQKAEALKKLIEVNKFREEHLERARALVQRAHSVPRDKEMAEKEAKRACQLVAVANKQIKIIQAGIAKIDPILARLQKMGNYPSGPDQVAVQMEDIQLDEAFWSRKKKDENPKDEPESTEDMMARLGIDQQASQDEADKTMMDLERLNVQADKIMDGIERKNQEAEAELQRLVKELGLE